jgi:hypothetical protein
MHFEPLTRDGLEKKKFEILYSLLERGSRRPLGTYYLRDLVGDLGVWRAWREANLGVFLWLGRRYYRAKKSAFKGIDHGAAIYLNQ